jgi:superfamily II DNA/RNA helicase
LNIDFSTLELSTKVTSAVADAGYTQPTDIQAKAIPHILAKRDVIGIAQTGTGKTASFVLPMLTMLERGRARARMPRTLILAPTRELAAQVHENFERYGKNHRLTVALLIGGVSFDEQNKKLDRGADVLIATPGRMLDHFQRGRLLLTGVEILVIDEADRMLDMGFIPDIERIVGLLPPRRQTLFFSATMPDEVRRLTKRFLRDPVEVAVARQATTADTIEQAMVRCSSKPAEKREALRALLRAETNLTNAIIFCNRKRDVATLARSLIRHKFDASALHGDMDQSNRTATLNRFRAGELSLLIASDVAARGLDIPAVSHVFNFDIPTHAEDYVHRVGRTGRAGRKGKAITLVTPSDQKYLAAIIELIGRDIPQIDAVDAPDSPPQAKPQPRPDTPEVEKPARRRSRRSSPSRQAATTSSGLDTDKTDAIRAETIDTRAPANASPQPVEQAQPAEQSRPVEQSQPAAQPSPAREPAPKTRPDAPSSRARNEKKSPPAGREEKKSGPFGDSDQVPAFLRRPVREAS